MLLSQSCKYGVRASVYLAILDRDTYVSIRELSNELNISFHFLTKIFQRLNAANLLDSKQGVNGGVKLSVPPNEITFMDIVMAIDGCCSMESCALGLPGCGEKRPCPMHEQWSAIKTGMLDMMKRVTIAELASTPAEEWKDLIVNSDSKTSSLNSEFISQQLK